MTDYTQTREDLEEHFEDQLKFLQASAISFDAGFEAEAKRIAISLRTLLHDTGKSHSLLGQLNRKSIQFLDTSGSIDPLSIVGQSGLATLLLTDSGGRYVALLDDPRLESSMKNFDDWWNAIIFRDSKDRELSRKGLVLAIANKDGGGHVDPMLDGVYADLSRKSSFSWTYIDGGTTASISGAHRAAIRQICHEVLKSLMPNYVKERDYSLGGVIIRSLTATVLDKLPLEIRQQRGRNRLCSCGSGAKFKRCCGSLLDS